MEHTNLERLRPALGHDDPVAVFMAAFEIVQSHMDATQKDLGLSGFGRDLWWLWDLWSQTTNGGLLQYFGNDAGDHVRGALAALRTIGAGDAAEALAAAMSRFGPTGPAPDRSDRAAQTDAWGEEEWEPVEELAEAMLDAAPSIPEAVQAELRRRLE